MSRMDKLRLRVADVLDKLNAEGRWTKYIEVASAWAFWAERQVD